MHSPQCKLGYLVAKYFQSGAAIKLCQTSPLCNIPKTSSRVKILTSTS